MQSILTLLVAGRYIKTRADTRTVHKPILAVFIRDHTWAFLLIFGKSWVVMIVLSFVIIILA